jgi:hypothetical protein
MMLILILPYIKNVKYLSSFSFANYICSLDQSAKNIYLKTIKAIRIKIQAETSVSRFPTNYGF